MHVFCAQGGEVHGDVDGAIDARRRHHRGGRQGLQVTGACLMKQMAQQRSRFVGVQEHADGIGGDVTGHHHVDKRCCARMSDAHGHRCRLQHGAQGIEVLDDGSTQCAQRSFHV
jgi:hypothetical protein